MKILSLALAFAMTGASLPASGQDPGQIPLGGEEAAEIVDQFFAALHGGDLPRMEALLTPETRWSSHAYGPDRLVEGDWLDRFWQYPLLQIQADAYPPVLRPEDNVRVTVVQRMASGSIVVQREAWEGTPADADESRHAEFLVAYQLRAGRIHRVWYMATQELEVPAGIRPVAAECRDPVIWFDAGHNNASTPDGLYSRPASVLREAGYDPRISIHGTLTPERLDSIVTLVIVNPVPDSHADYGRGPEETPTSAFTRQEIDALEDWVSSGGRLLLIADHDPWPAASADLARRFGARFHNGAAIDTTRPRGGGDLFSRQAGTLLPHPITDGAGTDARVDSVRTFLGQAFEIGPPLEPVLVLHDGMKLVPPGGMQSDPSSWIPAGGMAQAAAGRFDQGRVALLGEAWLFRHVDEVLAHGNTRFLLNLADWLTENTCTR